MNSQIVTNINRFIKKRLVELSGILLMLASIFLFIAVASYSPSDPNFIYAAETAKIQNLGGFYGSVISDLLLQSIGIVSFFIIINFFYWGYKLIGEKRINNFIPKIFFTLIYIIFGTTFVNIFYNESFWLIDNGNGGFVGQIIKENIYVFSNFIEDQYVVSILFLIAIIFFILSLGMKLNF